MKDLLQLNAPSQPGAPVMKFALSDGDQLYIYEACSTLIMASRLDNEVSLHPFKSSTPSLNFKFLQSKAALFHELVNPLLSRIRPLLDEMLSESNPERKEALADTVCHAMALTSRSSKAFSSQQSMKIVGCHKLYLQALETFFMLCLQVGKMTSFVFIKLPLVKTIMQNQIFRIIGVQLKYQYVLIHFSKVTLKISRIKNANLVF